MAIGLVASEFWSESISIVFMALYGISVLNPNGNSARTRSKYQGIFIWEN